ncbi:hypothetical protein [Coxiella-like endosymbiont]|nr:hypothetical protein [Coxiella-like endosymbiont]
MNEHGIIFKENYQKTLEWYQKSVDQGNHPIAQFLLENMYYLGHWDRL